MQGDTTLLIMALAGIALHGAGVAVLADNMPRKIQKILMKLFEK